MSKVQLAPHVAIKRDYVENEVVWQRLFQLSVDGVGTASKPNMLEKLENLVR